MADISQRTQQPSNRIFILFIIGCIIIFSKIVWYDLRVYADVADRRGLLTSLHASWLVAQIALYLVLARSLLSTLHRVWPALALWFALVAPFFVVGLIEGRLNVFYIGDLARYGLPVGFILYFAWAVRTFPTRTLIMGLFFALTVCVTARTALHLFYVDEYTLRYGVDWELFLLCLLLAGLIRFQRHYPAVLTVLASTALTLVLIYGQTRSLVGAAVVSSGVLAILIAADRRVIRPARFYAVIASFVIAGLVFVSVVSSIPGLKRMHVDAMVTPPEALQQLPEKSDLDWHWHFIPGMEENAARRADAHSSWIHALQTGKGSIATRKAEAFYFLTEMNDDARSFFLGHGAGGSTRITLMRGAERLVRGAHVTVVTLLHRHGAIIGSVLFALLCFWGLPQHLSEYRQTGDVDRRILLASLIAYRVAAIPLTFFHQGLFDDAIVMLSIAIALDSRSRNRSIPVTAGKVSP